MVTLIINHLELWIIVSSYFCEYSIHTLFLMNTSYFQFWFMPIVMNIQIWFMNASYFVMVNASWIGFFHAQIYCWIIWIDVWVGSFLYNIFISLHYTNLICVVVFVGNGIHWGVIRLVYYKLEIGIPLNVIMWVTFLW